MLLRITSDLHLEFHKPHDIMNKLSGSNVFVPPDDRDAAAILILAGDTVLISKLEAYKDFFDDVCERFRYVVYITGNHEYYRNESFEESHNVVRELEKEYYNFKFLQNESCKIEHLDIFGATLWTDMAHMHPACLFEAENCMPEYRSLVYKEEGKLFKPYDSVQLHVETKYHLNEFFENGSNLKKVVVTHHAPCYQSVGSRFIGSTLNGAFASELSEEILNWQPNLWVHGHMHDPSDYMIDQTRIICNPYGYPNELQDNGGHDDRLFIDV